MQENQEKFMKQKVEKFQLTSDIFFGKVLEDKKAFEEIVFILTRKRIVLKEVRTQYSVRNLVQHSIVIDVLGITVENELVLLEMHPQPDKYYPKRMRYYRGSVDLSQLKPGKPYKDMPNLCMVYITKSSKRQTCGIVKLKRVIGRSKISLEDGTEEYYVNLLKKAEREDQQQLLNYMINSDYILENKYFPNLVKRVRYLKEDQKGVQVMCEILEKVRCEGRREGRREGKSLGEKIMLELITKMLEDGKATDVPRLRMDRDFYRTMKKKYHCS